MNAFLSWAEKIGPNTKELIKSILDSREYAVQTYWSCMGILKLSKGYVNEIVENASREALDKNICSYKYFSIILKQAAAKAEENKAKKIIKHEKCQRKQGLCSGVV